MNKQKVTCYCAIRVFTLAVIVLALLMATSQAQEVSIRDFPLGQGGSVSADFFKPYYSQLQSIADTLSRYPLTRAVVTGGADGESFRQNSDSKNPGLALGRAHTLSRLLMVRFGVDSARIIIQSEDVSAKGPQYRHATVRIVWDLARLGSRLIDLASELKEVASRPPVEKQTTIVREVPAAISETVGLRLGVGLSSSPFGGIPIVSAAITWERTVFIEGIVGHTFWSGSFPFAGLELDTKRRMVSGQVIVQPIASAPVGLVGGWLRAEEIAPDYDQYAKMTEGLVLGLRVTPWQNLSLTGLYHPAQKREAGDRLVKSRTDQVLLSLTFHLDFGGKK